MSDLFNVFKAIASIKGGRKKKDIQGLNLETKIKGCLCEQGGKNDMMIWELKII